MNTTAPVLITTTPALTFSPLSHLPPKATTIRYKERPVRPTPGTAQVQRPRPPALPFALDQIDLGDPQLPINCVSAQHRPLATLVPQPRRSPTLLKDDWLARRIQTARSLHTVEQHRARRRQQEARQLAFTFPPLMTTLKNMRRFIRHIRAGHQFDAALTPREDRALAWVDGRTQALLAARAPYKRTVNLALVLMVLCEIITKRQVLDPLRQQQPALFKDARINTMERSIDPARVTAFCWGDNNPGGLDEQAGFLTDWLDSFSLYKALTHSLHDQDILIYPSFQALSVQDFCLFGHLALYPVGLTTDYALGADAILKSPLQFALHDLDHLHILQGPGTDLLARSQTERMLRRADLRLAWRQLLLDQMPEAISALDLKPALTLLLFRFLHEFGPEHELADLDCGWPSFVFCLEHLASARRAEWEAYEPDYTAITDSKAAVAALWTVQLWQQWRAGDLPSAERLDACARTFVSRQVPGLLEHMKFVECHRSRLRPLFASRDAAHFTYDNHFSISLLVNCGAGHQRIDLFQRYDPHSGLCHIDNTDLVYFSRLRYPDQRQKMTIAAGAPVPKMVLLDNNCQVVSAF